MHSKAVTVSPSRLCLNVLVKPLHFDMNQQKMMVEKFCETENNG